MKKEKVKWKEVGGVFEAIMANVLGSLDMSGVPETCQVGYSWKDKGSYQLVRVVGLSGPASHRAAHHIQSCGDTIVVSSAIQSTVSGQAKDNAQAERFGFVNTRTTTIDQKTGIILSSEFVQKLQSSSTQVVPNSVRQTITVVAK